MKTKAKRLVSLISLLCCSTLYAEVSYTKNYSEILKRLPAYSKEDIDGLIFRRQGKSRCSYMDALGLHQVFEKNKAYTLTRDGLRPSINRHHAKKVPDDFLVEPIKPKSILIKAKWLDRKEASLQKEEKISNILGGNGRLMIQIDAQNITLPIETATSQKLSYYGAVAVSLGETVSFPIEEVGYPIWAMSLGSDYTKNYLMTRKAGGWYLEWHTDRPHFHMPLTKDAGGFYVLGKAHGNEEFELTAFKIPYGTAVFTKRGTIHSDAGLIGERWIVGYTTSENYSTVLLRNNKNQYVDIEVQ